MIVTRQRKQKKSSLPILLPIAAIAMLVIALTWPPSRNFITNGPLQARRHRVRRGLGHRVPAADLRLPAAADHRPQRRRSSQLNDNWKPTARSAADKDAQVAQLQKQIVALNAQPRPDAGPGGRRRPVPPARPPGAAPVAAARPGGVGLRAPGGPAVGGDGPRKGRGPGPEAARPATCRPFLPRCRPIRSGPIMDALPAKVAALIVESGTQSSDFGSTEPIGRDSRLRTAFCRCPRTPQTKGGEK